MMENTSVFEGRSIRLTTLDIRDTYELCFDRQGDSVNKFDTATIDELRQVTRLLASLSNLRGVLITSGKPDFIVGADITEFRQRFAAPPAEVVADVQRWNEVFVEFEDLPAPSVAAINGYALGGGLEFALASTYRVMSDTAHTGLPEIKLGLFPGLGGTVRLPRIAGPQTACDWISSGSSFDAIETRAAGVVDDIASPSELRSQALHWLTRAMAGELDWVTAQHCKREPIAASQKKMGAIFECVRAQTQQDSPPHQPAALTAIDLMAQTASLDRTAALTLEANAVCKLAQGHVAAAMIQNFLSEQTLKKKIRCLTRSATQLTEVTVVGTGRLAQRIAAESRRHGLRVRAVDSVDTFIVRAGIEDPGKVDAVIEAAERGCAAEHETFRQMERLLKPTALLISTSGLPLTTVAAGLRDPSRLAGLHLLDPAPATPVVEVVRAPFTSEQTVANAMSYAKTLAPIQIEVRCGPLLRRVFASYSRAFQMLLSDGVSSEQIDECMANFGWQKGSARLLNADTRDVQQVSTLSQREILDRMMLPIVLEAARALQEQVVATAGEIDVAIRKGLGFPDHTGGPLKYAESLGLAEVMTRFERPGYFEPHSEMDPHSFVDTLRRRSYFY